MNNEEIKIESGIPIPESHAHHKGQSKYPFSKLQVGESFLFPDHVNRTNAESAKSRKGRLLNRKFVVRKTEDGLRCWRVE